MILIERDFDGNIMEVDGDLVCVSIVGVFVDLIFVFLSVIMVWFVYVYNFKRNSCIFKRSMFKNRNIGLIREI